MISASLSVTNRQNADAVEVDVVASSSFFDDDTGHCSNESSVELLPFNSDVRSFVSGERSCSMDNSGIDKTLSSSGVSFFSDSDANGLIPTNEQEAGGSESETNSAFPVNTIIAVEKSTKKCLIDSSKEPLVSPQMATGKEQLLGETSISPISLGKQMCMLEELEGKLTLGSGREDYTPKEVVAAEEQANAKAASARLPTGAEIHDGDKPAPIVVDAFSKTSIAGQKHQDSDRSTHSSNRGMDGEEQYTKTGEYSNQAESQSETHPSEIEIEFSDNMQALTAEHGPLEDAQISMQPRLVEIKESCKPFLDKKNQSTLPSRGNTNDRSDENALDALANRDHNENNHDRKGDVTNVADDVKESDTVRANLLKHHDEKHLSLNEDTRSSEPSNDKNSSVDTLGTHQMLSIDVQYLRSELDHIEQTADREDGATPSTQIVEARRRKTSALERARYVLWASKSRQSSSRLSQKASIVSLFKPPKERGVEVHPMKHFEIPFLMVPSSSTRQFYHPLVGSSSAQEKIDSITSRQPTTDSRKRNVEDPLDRPSQTKSSVQQKLHWRCQRSSESFG